MSRQDFFDHVHTEAPFFAIYKAQDEWNYERKEHRFTSSEDTTDILKIRYGVLRENQKKILKKIEKQGDRNVTVIYDETGNHGKSWLSIYLYEHGRSLVVPRASTTAEKLSAYVCSTYDGQEIISVDIPRSRPITPELYEAIEELKDGLVFDHRYSGKCRNIRGVKVAVFTNNRLDTTKLSKDRWNIIDHNATEIKLEKFSKAAKPTKNKKQTKTNSNQGNLSFS